MITSAVLALLFGGAGAWAYERFLGRTAAEGSPPAQGSQGQDPGARKDLATIEDRLKDLSTQYSNLADQSRQLQARLESTAKPAPAPDLAPIEQKVAQVDRLSKQLDAIEKKIDPLTQRFEQQDRRMTELDQKIDNLRQQTIAAQGRAPGGRDRQVTLTRADRPPPPDRADRPPGSTESGSPSPSTPGDSRPSGEGTENRPSPSSGEVESVEKALQTGVGLFQQKRYGDAYAAFRSLLQSHPDDARVWYYAALSYGLATGNWDRMTQTMAEEGVAREKAGKPPKAVIDSAFAGLTKETGKDWLAFYRRRAA